MAEINKKAGLLVNDTYPEVTFSVWGRNCLLFFLFWSAFTQVLYLTGSKSFTYVTRFTNTVLWS